MKVALFKSYLDFSMRLDKSINGVTLKFLKEKGSTSTFSKTLNLLKTSLPNTPKTLFVFYLRDFSYILKNQNKYIDIVTLKEYNTLYLRTKGLKMIEDRLNIAISVAIGYFKNASEEQIKMLSGIFEECFLSGVSTGVESVMEMGVYPSKSSLNKISTKNIKFVNRKTINLEWEQNE